MTDTKVSAMTAATDLADADLMYLIQSAADKKISVETLRRALREPRYSMEFFEEFWQTLANSNRQYGLTYNFLTLSTVAPNEASTEKSFGVVGMLTTSTSSNAVIYMAPTPATTTARTLVALDSTPIIVEFRVRILTALPAATNPVYTVKMGLRRVPDYLASSNDGVYAEAFWDTDSSQVLWRLVAESVGTPTNSNASSGPALSTWYRVRVVCTSAGASLYVNGSEVATVSTGLPTAAMGPWFGFVKTSGAQNLTVHLDYMWFYKAISAGR